MGTAGILPYPHLNLNIWSEAAHSCEQVSLLLFPITHTCKKNCGDYKCTGI